MGKTAWLDWSKTAKQFSVNSRGKFRYQFQGSRRTVEEALDLIFSLIQFIDIFQLFRLLF